MGRIGWMEILVIVVVIMLLFGTKRLPEMGSSIAKAIREFRKAFKESDDQDSTNQKSDDGEDELDYKEFFN